MPTFNSDFGRNYKAPQRTGESFALWAPGEVQAGEHTQVSFFPLVTGGIEVEYSGSYFKTYSYVDTVEGARNVWRMHKRQGWED